MLDHRTVRTFELHGQLALAGELEVGGAVLVAISVTADDDWLGPARHQARNIGDHDRLAEDDAAKDVTDRAVRRTPHLLEAELLNAGLIRRDGRTFDTDTVFLDRIRGVDRDLVIGFVARFDAEIEVFQIDIEIGVNEPVLDHLPDDAGHLIAIELDDGIFDLDLCHRVEVLSVALYHGRL